MKIAVGTDAPAIPHGKNASELVALVSRGMTPLDVLRAATVTAAELIGVTDRGRLAPGLLADVIGGARRSVAGHHRHAGRAVRDEGREGL